MQIHYCCRGGTPVPRHFFLLLNIRGGVWITTAFIQPLSMLLPGEFVEWFVECFAHLRNVSLQCFQLCNVLSLFQTACIVIEVECSAEPLPHVESVYIEFQRLLGTFRIHVGSSQIGFDLEDVFFEALLQAFEYRWLTAFC
jgi:hypothetical protein